MAFDAFGDGPNAGYLRNVHGLAVGKRLKMFEHHAYQSNLPGVLDWLSSYKRQPGYDALLEVHGRLFGELYPWAGKDRLELTPDRNVRKGSTEFAQPQNLRKAFNEFLKAKTPGRALGHLAYCHPFLECNGRAIFTFFDDHLRRKGKQLDWTGLDERSFLLALDRQIAEPDSDALDNLLDPLITLNTTGSRPQSSLLGVNWTSRKPK